MPGVNPSEFKTYDEFAKAAMASKSFQSLPSDDPRRTMVLQGLRNKYYEAHGVHKEIGPTDITPPTPTKKEGAVTTEPTPLPAHGDPTADPSKAAPPTDQPDLAGRVKAGAESGLGYLDKQAGESSGLNDPIRLLVHALPGDNIQAGIDAAMALSMLTGAGEVEGAGGLAYKALRALPAPVRGLGRLAAREAITTAGGAIGGATEGKAGQGAATGAAEQTFGEVASGIGRGLFGLSNKAIQKTDLRSVGNWLRECLPDFPGMGSIKDFRKLFLRGELEDAASEKLSRVEDKIGKQLNPKGSTSTTKATVSGPGQQDIAQQEALVSVQSTAPKPAHETPSTVFGQKPQEEVFFGDEQPQKTVFAPNSKGAAYQKVKDIEAELKAAKESIQTTKKGGSGLSAETSEINKRAAAGEAKLNEIRGRLKQAQADARSATKGASSKRMSPEERKADAAARFAQLPPEKPQAYEPPQKKVTPTLNVELPGPMADYMKLPRRSPLDFEWKDLTVHLNETENKGWALIGNPDPEKAELGKALRSSVFQAEHDAADALRLKVGDKMADEWLAQRQQYRASRVLTQLFRTPNLVDASGNIAWDEIQKLVDAAGREGFYDDLKLAFGKEGADGFIDKLTRGAPNERDIPGRGVLTTHSRVYMHPGLGKLSPRIPLQIPVPTVRAGDVPFNLGRNRALSALMVLGPERFVQMVDDMTKMGPAKPAH